MGWWPFTKRTKRTTAMATLRAKYDAAQTTADNRRHWANADQLSANAAASPFVRATLRNRARYEVANGCYAQGIVLTLANDVIGTGPRLQMLTNLAKVNQDIERQFAGWCKAVGLAAKLRTMRMARAQDGEAFALLFTNGNLDSPIKLDLRLIEADQVATPSAKLGIAGAALAVDGIEFDPFGNPAAYHVLKSHPGSSTIALATNFDRVRAENMIHWFRCDRPGQSRGVSELAPSLNLFGQLRQYRQAVLDAARTAANVALFMKTTMPASGEAQPVEPMTEMEFSPNMAIFGPEGWEPSQIKAEQPTASFKEVCEGFIAEAGRPWSMPKNVSLCDSSGYNYASGRLDHQTYFKNIRVEQSDLEDLVLDRILAAWLEEAIRVFDIRSVEQFEHQWFWDGREHVDPAKEATAQETRLTNYATNLAYEYARQGKDWETELKQRAKEVELMKTLGLPMPPPKTPQIVAPEAEEDT